jgi:NAD dependent epimerase/dehydratase family enzyme
MADSMLLTSQRVAPARLAGFGYPFRDPDVQSALIQVLSP